MNKINGNLKKHFERSSTGSVLYIRHGQTHFNKFSHDYTEEVAKFKIEFLDSELNEKGKEQSLSLINKLGDFKIKYVFCSPLHRCLETCALSLKDHPDKENIKVVIHPLITETVHCIHDFSKRIFEKKKNFNYENTKIHFDWSLFESLYSNEYHQENYFIDFMDNLPDNEHELVEKIKNERDHLVKEDLLLELSKYATDMKKRPESLTYMFRRNLKFKEYLNSLNINDSDDEKVLVFTHSCFIQISTSQKAHEMDIINEFPDDSYKPENCEIITMYI